MFNYQWVISMRIDVKTTGMGDGKLRERFLPKLSVGRMITVTEIPQGGKEDVHDHSIIIDSIITCFETFYLPLSCCQRQIHTLGV
jgi:hypothetical protein